MVLWESLVTVAREAHMDASLSITKSSFYQIVLEKLDYALNEIF